jgi:two-component system, chemotaxis family, response regulator Rcp1
VRVTPPQQHTAMELGPTPRPDLERVEILLVEDHPGDVRLTREVLREQKVGNELHVVADGLEALAFLRREGPYAEAPRPDLVLLDLDLSRKNGREVLEEMKRDPALREIPVVIVTASRVEADACRALRLGAAGFISKPVDFQKFARIVQDVTDLWIAIVTVRPDVPPPDAVLIH